MPFTESGCGWGPGHVPFYESPQSCTNKVGGSVSLSAWAPAALSYQWLEDGAPLEGETGTVLRVDWCKSRDSIDYSVLGTFEVDGSRVTRESPVAEVVMGEQGLFLIFR